MSLSRKYRPITFGDVINQDHIKVTLQNELISGKLAHAFLFCGPRGLGKTTLARILARAVNCEKLSKDAEPCNKCEACQRNLDNKSIDIVEIDAASHTGVDNVRQEIIENVRFNPGQEKNKVFIIDEVHMLSSAAFNALLKTLEEPPERVIFILATTEAYRLPDTIVSRCQQFNFKKISIPKIVARLQGLLHKEHRDVADEVLYEIARSAGGCIRDAETLLDQVLVVKKGRIKLDDVRFILPQSYLHKVLDLLEYISACDEMHAIEYVNTCAEDGVHMDQFCDEIIENLRKILLGQTAQKLLSFATDFSQDIEERFNAIMKAFSREDSMRLLYLLLEIRELFGKTAAEQFPIEVAIMQYFIKKKDNTSSLLPSSQNELSKEPRKDSSQTTLRASIGLDTLTAKWNDVINLAGDFNYSLKLILGLIRPMRVQSGKVYFFCPYKFHIEKLKEQKTREILEKLLERVYGHRFKYVLELESQAPKNQATEEKKIQNLGARQVLEVLGGEVV